MIITQQPVPKTIEDLAQEVSEDTRLARLEHQRALQDEAIRSYKLDTVVVGAPQPTPATSEADSDDTDPEETSGDQEYDEDEDEFEEEE